MKRCHEHASPTGGNITLTLKPYWLVRSRKKAITGQLTATRNLTGPCPKPAASVVGTVEVLD